MPWAIIRIKLMAYWVMEKKTENITLTMPPMRPRWEAGILLGVFKGDKAKVTVDAWIDKE